VGAGISQRVVGGWARLSSGWRAVFRAASCSVLAQDGLDAGWGDAVLLGKLLELAPSLKDCTSWSRSEELSRSLSRQRRSVGALPMMAGSSSSMIMVVTASSVRRRSARRLGVFE
jgi:hypothetical protein